VPGVVDLVRTGFGAEYVCGSSFHLRMRSRWTSFTLPGGFDGRRDEELVTARVAGVCARVSGLVAEGAGQTVLTLARLRRAWSGRTFAVVRDDAGRRTSEGLMRWFDEGRQLEDVTLIRLPPYAPEHDPTGASATAPSKKSRTSDERPPTTPSAPSTPSPEAEPSIRLRTPRYPDERVRNCLTAAIRQVRRSAASRARLLHTTQRHW
jgi:hypothetical protein